MLMDRGGEADGVVVVGVRVSVMAEGVDERVGYLACYCECVLLAEGCGC